MENLEIIAAILAAGVIAQKPAFAEGKTVSAAIGIYAQIIEGLKSREANANAQSLTSRKLEFESDLPRP